MNEEPLQKIRKARRMINAVLTNNSVLSDSNEISEFERSFQLTRMWLGKLMYYLGDKNPYAEMDGKRKSIVDIAPVADKAEKKDIPACILVADKIDYVELVDRLRTECQRIEDVITKTEFPGNLFVNETQTIYAHMTLQECWKYIVGAKMWLGQELNRVRDENLNL